MELMEPIGEVVAFEQKYVQNFPKSGRDKGGRLKKKGKKK